MVKVRDSTVRAVTVSISKFVIEDVSCRHDGGLGARKLAKLGRFCAS